MIAHILLGAWLLGIVTGIAVGIAIGLMIRPIAKKKKVEVK